MTQGSIDQPQVEGLVSLFVAGQAFGVPVLSVQDVILQPPINNVPLAPTEVAGLLNLRGRIVTAIDLRRRLGLDARSADAPHMCVIVENGGELYALMVDDVGDVLWISSDRQEQAPPTLPPRWRQLCSALYQLDGELLLALRVDEVLSLEAPNAQGRVHSAPDTYPTHH